MLVVGLRDQYMPDMHLLKVQLYQLSRLLHDECAFAAGIISAQHCV
jgi:hypothetical protein